MGGGGQFKCPGISSILGRRAQRFWKGILIIITAPCICKLINVAYNQELAEWINRLDGGNTILVLCFGDSQ